jgi:hypothetical protein
VLATLALLSLVGFWLGLTPVLAAGTLAIQRSGRVGKRSGPAAVGLAGLALLAYVALVVVDLVTA